MLEEIEDEENINQETESDEKKKLNCKEFLRRYYYKHYEKWSILTISVILGNYIGYNSRITFIQQTTFLPALGGLLVLAGQWSERIEIFGIFLLIVGVSLCVVRCLVHYASLSERRRVLPYIG